MTDKDTQHSREDLPADRRRRLAVLALAGIVTIILTFIALPLGSFARLMVCFATSCGFRGSFRRCQRHSAPADGKVLAVVSGDAEVPAGTGIEAGHRITIRTGLADAAAASPLAGRIVDNFLIPGLLRRWRCRAGPPRQ